MRIDTKEESWYGVHEVYYKDDGSLWLYSENPCSIIGETIEELKEEIKRFQCALNEPVLTPEDFKTTDIPTITKDDTLSLEEFQIETKLFKGFLEGDYQAENDE